MLCLPFKYPVMGLTCTELTVQMENCNVDFTDEWNLLMFIN